MRKLKPSQKRIRLKNGTELQYHTPADRVEPKRLQEQLPNLDSRLLEVEIGSGKGEFIARRAAQHPERFFVGIDRRRDRFDLTNRKLSRLEEKNWMLLQEDARCFLSAGLPRIQVLHVYHPDPWPKEKHHKHRFFRSPDARVWAEALNEGGEFRIQTDHRGYFEEILAIVGSWDFLENRWIAVKEAHHGAPMTHFEGIFLRKKEPVYKALFVRVRGAK